MPIYEYECPTHGRYEVNQRITESALKTCKLDDCSQPVRKLISSTAFALKGGGWYSDGYGAGKSGASTTASAPAKSDGTKSETAPAAKADSGGGCGAGACGAGACATPAAKA